MTRIRYKTDTSGTLISKSMMSANGEVVVNIKPDGSWVICSSKGELVHNSTETSTIPKAKKTVKTALKYLGVVFEDEVRPRLVTTAEDEASNDYDQEHRN